MKKVLIISAIIVIILIIGAGYKILTKETLPVSKEKNSMPEINLHGKKIAMIVAFRDFRDEEYFIPKQIFEEVGAKVVTASSSVGQAIGISGGEAEIDILLSDLKVEDFDAVVFIGGSGAIQYIDDATCNKIIQETLKANKVLAAICAAPAILAQAGALEDKKATVWNSVLDKSLVKILEKNKAIFQKGPVVISDNIITANGPDAAEEFARKIVELLK